MDTHEISQYIRGVAGKKLRRGFKIFFGGLAIGISFGILSALVTPILFSSKASNDWTAFVFIFGYLGFIIGSPWLLSGSVAFLLSTSIRKCTGISGWKLVLVFLCLLLGTLLGLAMGLDEHRSGEVVTQAAHPFLGATLGFFAGAIVAYNDWLGFGQIFDAMASENTGDSS